LHGWPDLRAVLAVETIRSVNGTGPVEAEIRYFLTSCSDAPAVLVRAIRRHWSVENALHWVLDVTFREDDSRVRDRTAARNFALLRKIALNLVAKDRSTQTSLRGKRKRAAWDDGYMLQILAHQAHA
jgi:predicted transposase YbfD/YdcC